MRMRTLLTIALNEQLRSDHDRWLIWVGAAIAKRSTSAAGKN